MSAEMHRAIGRAALLAAVTDPKICEHVGRMLRRGGDPEYACGQIGLAIVKAHRKLNEPAQQAPSEHKA